MRCRVTTFLILVLVCTHALALRGGVVEHHQVHGQSLKHNVTGEETSRTVAVYLPPAYEDEPGRRYPVVYLLHGIMDTETEWTVPWYDPDDPWGTIERLMNQGIAAGRLQPMIIVMPDQKTRAAGSFYANSAVTGNWEDFTVHELVNWTDERYRTISHVASRGIAGHSMGGYGALVLAMKYPDRFSVVYAMNPAVLGWAGDLSTENPAFRTVIDRSDWSEMDGFYEPAVICIGQAFSPNPDRPPFFVDLPFKVENNQLVPNQPAFDLWEAHFPLNMAARYQANLKRLKGIRFDSGYEDEFTHIPPTNRAFSKRLTELGVRHIFEEYNGDHRNRLWGETGRLYTEVLPWFSLLLAQQPPGESTDRAVAP